MALRRRKSSMRRARRGFTLLEMLGVIGIMLILVSLAVIAFETLDRSASGKQTRATLDDCTAMLNEYENEAGAGALGNLGTGGPEPTGGFPYPGGAYAVAGGELGYNNSTPYIEVTSMVYSTVPAAANPTTVLSGGYGRYGAAVQYTWYVMANLMRIPKVKDMVQKLPTSRVLTATNTTTGTTVPYTPTGATAGAGVVLLDGWGNPIIFVPSGGINVWKKGQSTPTLIQSRDLRPFFASAGPDGDFGADNNATVANPTTTDSWSSTSMGVTRTPMGDDNIYSFENGQ
jgi:prepilin-type N-terminal cleavage/methylation domain-containing protein